MTNKQANAAAAASATASLRTASATWSNNLTDEDPTLGIGFKQAGVMRAMIKRQLTGTCQVEKNARIMLGHAYRRRNAVDYDYDGYQILKKPSPLLPTNQQAGEYSNSVVSVGYIQNFCPTGHRAIWIL